MSSSNIARKHYNPVGIGGSESEIRNRIGIAPRCFAIECHGVPRIVGRLLSTIFLIALIVMVWPCATSDLKALPCALLLIAVLLQYMPIAGAFIITRAFQFASGEAKPPLSLGALHSQSWIRNGTFHTRVHIEDLRIRNASANGKFSEEFFLDVEQFSLHYHVGFGTIWNLLCGGCCSLSSPSAWVRRPFKRTGVDAVAGKRPRKEDDRGSPQPFGLINIGHIEAENVRVNLETAESDGELNVCAFRRVLDARRLAKHLKLSKNGSPNMLKVTVCRVRNLPIAAETIVLDVRGQDRVVSKSFSSSQTNSMEFKSSTRISSAVSASPLSPSERQIGESFEFFVEHESAVLHVETRQGGISENGVLVGQWIVPLIDILVEPRRCRHNGNLKVDSSTRQIEGWFPFRDHRFRQEGSCGEVQLKLQWEVSEVDEEIRSMSQDASNALTPLKQLGIMLRDQRARNNGFDPIGFAQDLPVRLLCDRITLRNLILNVGALLPPVPDSKEGYQRRFSFHERGRYNGVPIKHLEASGRQLLPRRGDVEGLSVLQLAVKAGTALAPEIMKVPELNEIFSYVTEEGLMNNHVSRAQSSDYDDEGKGLWWTGNP